MNKQDKSNTVYRKQHYSTIIIDCGFRLIAELLLLVPKSLTPLLSNDLIEHNE